MKIKNALLLGLGLSLFAVTNCVPALAGNTDTIAESDFAAAPINQNEFRAAMRKLWEDHITWTRLFIISDAANLPDKTATTQRLLRNQQDIGDAISPFYGRQAGAKLTQLLRDHILIAAQVVDAAKARDNNRLNRANTQWYSNADQIAAFLAGANPRNWALAEMQNMMHSHLQLTTTEAVTYLQGNFSASIAAYDQVHLQILGMADMLSSGIIRQFPRAFH
ncbi:MAG: glycosyltransferase [Bdellovibrionota bacterium]